jgi:anti-anti-sigma factor
MRWSTRDEDGHAVVTICGSVDMEDAPRLRLLLKPQGMSCQLVVDISDVTFLGPAAVDVIAAAVGQLRTCAFPMAIVVGDRNPQVRQALEEAGLQPVEELA